MSKLERFGVSMESELIKNFDKAIKNKGYANRSEAIRDLVRAALVEESSRVGSEDVIGTITIVYSHHIHDLNDTLNHIQHHFHGNIISTVHVHLNEHDCMEVLIVRGRADTIKQVADKLISTKGVRHGKLTVTATGRK
jgi:CopG family transcriptional regulator, nickel-responsive regulator